MTVVVRQQQALLVLMEAQSSRKSAKEPAEGVAVWNSMTRVVDVVVFVSVLVW